MPQEPGALKLKELKVNQELNGTVQRVCGAGAWHVEPVSCAKTMAFRPK